MNAASPPSPLDAPVDDLLGRTIADGRYRLESVLGSGAFGVVYRARHLALDRDVAIKILHGDLVRSHPSVAERFKREAQAASMLRHRNTVQVLDFGDDGGRLFLVMEYLDGHSLFELAHRREQPLSVVEIVDVMAQVLAGLAAAHDLDIVHRDIKPENVLVELDTRDDGSTGYRARVCDFGLAKLQTRDGESDRASLTARGEIFGTPEYMSPEQARGEPLDARSDLYACGVMLYQLGCGRVPFDAETPVGILMRHITDVPAPPRELAPELPEVLEAIILKALAKSPDDRFQSAREMRTALVQLTGDVDASWLSGVHALPLSDDVVRATRPQPSPPVPFVVDDETPRPPNRATLLVVALAVLAVVAAIVIVAMTRPGQEPEAPATPAVAETPPTSVDPVASAPAEIADDELVAAPSADATSVAQALTRGLVRGATERASLVQDEAVSGVVPAALAPDVDQPVRGASAARPDRGRPRPSAPETVPDEAPVPPKPAPEPAAAAEVSQPDPEPTPEPGPEPSPAIARTALVEPEPTPAPALEASVSIGSVNTKGSLPRTSVARALEGSQADLEACYRTAARSEARDEAAQLAVAFEVDVDGWVRDVRVGQGGLPGLRGCVAEVIGKVRTRERPDTGTVLAGAKIRFSPR